MKRLSIFLVVVMLAASFSACGNSRKYQDATTALNSGDYNTAIALFTELAEANYEDSAQQLKEAKYLYACNNLDRDNQRTVIYLEELSKIGYKDATGKLASLYEWKAAIAISTLKQTSVHRDTVDATSQVFPFYYFNFRIYGGPPDGEFRGTYEIIFSNGETFSDVYIGRDNDFYFAITVSATENALGKTIFNVYGENNELLATATSIIS